MNRRLAALAFALALPLLVSSCTSSDTPHPSPSASGSVAPSPAALDATVATELVRAGAVEATPVASAPIASGSDLAGGTFWVYSVRSTGASTRLEFGVSVPGGIDNAGEFST